MAFYEAFILIFVFLVLNVPIYLSLERYIFKNYNIYLKLFIGLLYWFAAFFTQQLMPFIGVIVLLVKVHSKEEDSGLRDFNVWVPNPVGLAVTAGLAVVFKLLINRLNDLYVYILSGLLNMETKPQEIVGEFAEGGAYYKAALFILVVVLAPFVEEYIFRYYIYDRLLLPRMPAFAAALISAALFTVLHYNISGIPTFFCLGIFCAFMYEKKGYYGAVTAHMVSNLMTALFLI